MEFHCNLKKNLDCLMKILPIDLVIRNTQTNKTLLIRVFDAPDLQLLQKLNCQNASIRENELFASLTHVPGRLLENVHEPPPFLQAADCSKRVRPLCLHPGHHTGSGCLLLPGQWPGIPHTHPNLNRSSNPRPDQTQTRKPNAQ